MSPSDPHITSIHFYLSSTWQLLEALLAVVFFLELEHFGGVHGDWCWHEVGFSVFVVLLALSHISHTNESKIKTITEQSRRASYHCLWCLLAKPWRCPLNPKLGTAQGYVTSLRDLDIISRGPAASIMIYHRCETTNFSSPNQQRFLHSKPPSPTTGRRASTACFDGESQDLRGPTRRG